MFHALASVCNHPRCGKFSPAPFVSVFFVLFFTFYVNSVNCNVVLITTDFTVGGVGKFTSVTPVILVLKLTAVIVKFFFRAFFSVSLLTTD